MKNSYDIVIIGAGVNGLIAGNLLAKEGKSAIILESRGQVGGMYSTTEFHPGFMCNIIYDHLPWVEKNILKKLNLNNLKLKYSPRETYHVGLDENLNHLIFSDSLDETMKSISVHSNKDAENWPLFLNYIEMLTDFIKPIYFSIPPKIKELNLKDAIALKTILKPFKKYGTRGLVELLRATPMMMPELLDEWFESKLLRGNLSAKGIMHINQGPYSAATALNFIHQHVFSKGKVFGSLNIDGGNDNFIKTIYNNAINNKVKISLNSEVIKISCDKNKCVSVITKNGDEYKGKKIISSLNLDTTFNKLIGAKYLSPNFSRQINNIKYRGSTARIHFALNGLPKIKNLNINQMSGILSISPSINYLEKAHDNIKYGDYAQNPHFNLAFPSTSNPNFAPKGKHVMSATLQHIPYKLKNSNWDDNKKNALLKISTEIIEKYIPNFSKYIEFSSIMMPKDLENLIGIKEGSIHHGELSLDQFYFNRPTMKTAQYSTPFNNLFLCGSATHPGGGLYGINAYNAVKKIIKT